MMDSITPLVTTYNQDSLDEVAKGVNQLSKC